MGRTQQRPCNRRNLLRCLTQILLTIICVLPPELPVTFSGCASSAKAKCKQVKKYTHLEALLRRKSPPSRLICNSSPLPWSVSRLSHPNKTRQMPCLCSDWMGMKLRIKLLNVCNPSSFTFFF